MADCAPSARRAQAMAAWATSPGVVAAASAELSWCRCRLRSRLTNSVSVRRARSTAWAAVPVMVMRKDWSGGPMSRSSSQCTTTTPMVWSETTMGTTASARKRLGSMEARTSGRCRRRSSRDSANIAAWWPRIGPSWRSDREDAVDGFVGVVAEATQRAQAAVLAEDGEGRRVDPELVAQGGEDGVGHLGGIGRRGQCPRHALHALGGLGRHPSPPLVAGFGTGRPQLRVALAAQVGHPHGHAGGRQLCHDAAACD